MGSVTRDLALQLQSLQKAVKDEAELAASTKAITQADINTETHDTLDRKEDARAKINRRAVRDSQVFKGWHRWCTNPNHALIANLISDPIKVKTYNIGLNLDVSGLTEAQIAVLTADLTKLGLEHHIGIDQYHSVNEGGIFSDYKTVLPTKPATF